MTSQAWVFVSSCPRAFLLPSPILLSGVQVGAELLEMGCSPVTRSEVWDSGKKREGLLPVLSKLKLFGLKFLVLAACQAQLSKELLVPVGGPG